MSKEKATHVKSKDSTGKITVADLAAEYGKEPKIIRIAIRAAGLRAPELPKEEGTFGPKAKYEWAPESKELEQVYEAVDSYIAELEAKAAERATNGGRTDAQLKADKKLKEMAEARIKNKKDGDDSEEVESKPKSKTKVKSSK